MSLLEKYRELPLEDVIGDRFGRYSKYIIQERALPDARDGLKPVQRRILYAMYAEGNTNEKPYRKSAKTVGNVIGNYHPHGDSSVYEAMVRMSQDWKVRNVLIQMHGNNGSIDGDPAAAMRYTEARLSAIASELLRDIDKETVEFAPNFDDTTEEPIVLPSMYPNLLVNGSTGISAGYATEIPPHHLGEVIDAVTMQIDNPDVSLDELMTVIKGPDFPTGGIVQGVDGIKKAFETGKGRFIIRAKTEIESLKVGRQQIVITEVPFEVNKANLVKRMDELRLDKKVDGIAEIRDETDRTGLRIVIELRKDGNAEGVLNYFFKNTDLQVSYNYNMVAIHNKTPKLMGLKAILNAYIQHQIEVVTRRTKYDLRKAEERSHIVEGLIKAISILDEVIETIRASKDKRNAKDNIIEKFQFTEAQAEAIVTLQLYRLTNTDITTLQKEAEELEKKIEHLRSILNSDKKLYNVIKKELSNVKKKYADPRRTQIEAEIQEIKIDMEVMIPSEDVMVMVTEDGYIKRSSIRSYSASNGELPGMKETDSLLLVSQLNTTDTMLMFTNKGNYIYLPVYEMPEIRWKDMGQHLASIVGLDKDEKLIKAYPVKEFKEDQFLIFFTKQGMTKKTELMQYKATRYNRTLMAIKLKSEDEVVDVSLTNGNQDVFIATHFGYGLWFHEEEISLVGQRAAGVKGINLKAGDYLVSGFAITNHPETAQVLIATQRGAMKKMKITEFDKTSRAKRGLVMIRELKSNPHRIVGMKLVTDEEKQFVLETASGKQETVSAENFKSADRYNNGSFVVDTGETGQITRLKSLISTDSSKE
ncbi:DNA topoisomerase IV subunit A [Fictibacillus phosphorivorans]|uniref:DNA topoisomerase IV subunit A n=1 Tax=Fictibacillus phosphorivorans TaxID=1221500 RepID=UPI00203C826C|nr:DNA topoisomerase IV subunit A [Fictibacillus phosphorivorans]MCM3718860.1 DNA topoisomerase IV subunit A [Fictibacillus phosphorivorans]MCM3776482.1 DNA topoisomerase IV subunit A [Fictibacillus phosphorivorans]